MQLVSTTSYSLNGLDYEEQYYKVPSSLSVMSSFSGDIVPYSSGPEEGDFKILIIKGTLAGKNWFTEVKGLLNYLSTAGSYNAASILSNFISQPIIGLFTSQAMTLVQQGMLGSGTAYSMERTVHKWGQIFHNGTWVDYYHGTQREVYWGQIIYVYDTTPGRQGTVLWNESKDYNESYGYNPIYVNATSNFRDNNKVYQLALSSYQSNGYWYGDSGSNVLSTPYWLTGISKNY